MRYDSDFDIAITSKSLEPNSLPDTSVDHDLAKFMKSYSDLLLSYSPCGSTIHIIDTTFVVFPPILMLGLVFMRAQVWLGTLILVRKIFLGNSLVLHR
jgi:hypothetical protein